MSWPSTRSPNCAPHHDRPAAGDSGPLPRAPPRHGACRCRPPAIRPRFGSARLG
jgi:hypothetical protein